MVKRLLIGMFKGLLIGGLVGAAVYGGLHWGVVQGLTAYALYGVLGALTGALAGKPFWRAGAGIEAALRAVFGIAVGCGLYALAAAFLPFDALQLPQLGAALPPAETASRMFQQPALIGPAIAVLYAALLELDNDGKGDDVAAAKVRVASVDDIDVGEEDTSAASSSRAAATKAKR